jgi:hypothetical protein
MYSIGEEVVMEMKKPKKLGKKRNFGNMNKVPIQTYKVFRNLIGLIF